MTAFLFILCMINIAGLFVIGAAVREVETIARHAMRASKSIELEPLKADMQQTRKDVDELYAKLYEVGKEWERFNMNIIDLSNKYTVLKHAINTLAQKSVFSHPQNMEQFKEADEAEREAE